MKNDLQEITTLKKSHSEMFTKNIDQSKISVKNLKSNLKAQIESESLKT